MYKMQHALGYRECILNHEAVRIQCCLLNIIDLFNKIIVMRTRMLFKINKAQYSLHRYLKRLHENNDMYR